MVCFCLLAKVSASRALCVTRSAWSGSTWHRSTCVLLDMSCFTSWQMWKDRVSTSGACSTHSSSRVYLAYSERQRRESCPNLQAASYRMLISYLKIHALFIIILKILFVLGLHCSTQASLVVALGLLLLSSTGSRVCGLRSCSVLGFSCLGACGILALWPGIKPVSPFNKSS